ncbi:hypothetical protein SK128_016160 [Halocaridina rubra]|uniref:Uncharacterized protein n=1 Tax=Halocaridina rubra TaxID=373956 RepID=A0AAN9A0N9_HALRR
MEQPVLQSAVQSAAPHLRCVKQLQARECAKQCLPLYLTNYRVQRVMYIPLGVTELP